MRLTLSLIMLLFFACDNGGDIDSLGNVMSANYGVGAPCGGSVMNYNGSIYRTYTNAGGVAPLDESNLAFMVDKKIGDYNIGGYYVYHAEIVNGDLWLSIVNDASNDHFVKVLNSSGDEIASYDVGIYPGDFIAWNDSYVFVANEGNYGASNGSISIIDNNGNVNNTGVIGDVVQSLEIFYGDDGVDKLIVLVNNSHKIKIFNIRPNNQGLAMPGIEVETGNSSPREMVVVGQKVYFTNWDTQDIKVFNLFSYEIENSIFMHAGLPEDIVTDGYSLYVAIPNIEKYDRNLGSDVVKISIDDLSVQHTYDVGFGPEALTFSDTGNLYISRRTYSEDWYTTYHGTSKIIAP